MEQPNGSPCPRCGAPRHRDNTPSCACTLHASDALRDARTAEAAAAEDFDPLRIRPYVELDGGPADRAPDAPDDAPDRAPGAGRAPGNGSARDVPARPEGARAADATMPLRAVAPDAPPGAPAPAGAPAGPSDAGSPTAVLPTPLAPPATEPSATDLDLFETARPRPPADAPAGDGAADRGAVPARRRRRAGLLAAAGAAVAVVGVAGWASGLFSYETPSRDGTPPRDIRAGVPDLPAAPSSTAPATGAPSSAPASVSPSAPASTSASPSASPSPSASGTTPGPSRSAGPSATPTAAASTAGTPGAGSPQEDGRDAAGPVLRRGDRGPEVSELQLRLHQLYLYNDAPDGRFTQRLEDSLRAYQWSRGLQGELGVYGPGTRARLESETREP